jgi:acyl-CoA dehydrogenase
MNHALSEVQKGFEGILANLPVPGLTWFFAGPLRGWSDLNAMTREANDRQTHKIASLILADTEQRIRHTAGIYVPDNTIEKLGLLEEAFRVVKRAEEVEKKIRAAIKANTIPRAKGDALYQSALEGGVITSDEYTLLVHADELRAASVAVDDFSEHEYLRRSAPGMLREVTPKGETHDQVLAS